MKSRYFSLLLLCLSSFSFLSGKPSEDFSFRVDITSIRESGFMKLLEKKFPQAQMLIDQAGKDDDFQEFSKLTGLKIEDLASIEISASGLDKIMAAQTAGRDPKLGSEVGFVVVMKAKGKVNVDAVMKLMMETLEEEEGPEARNKGRIDAQDSGRDDLSDPSERTYD